MPKWIVIILLLALSALLPWLAFEIWELFPYDLRINANLVRYITYAGFGIVFGYLIWRQRIKLIILPIIFVAFGVSSLIWSINRFEANKLDYKMGVYDDLPESIPACVKESNYIDFWDYIANGCHYSAADLAGGYLNHLLILTLAILTTRILLIAYRSKRKNHDTALLDQ